MLFNETLAILDAFKRLLLDLWCLPEPLWTSIVTDVMGGFQISPQKNSFVIGIYHKIDSRRLFSKEKSEEKL